MQGPETRSSNSVSVGHEIDFIFKLNLSCSGVEAASDVKPVATRTSSYCRYDIVPYHGLCLPRGRRGRIVDCSLASVGGRLRVTLWCAQAGAAVSESETLHFLPLVLPETPPTSQNKIKFCAASAAV